MNLTSLFAVQLELLNMDPTFLNRNVNEGFSGGEKKRNEILQLAVLEVGLAGLAHGFGFGHGFALVSCEKCLLKWEARSSWEKQGLEVWKKRGA